MSDYQAISQAEDEGEPIILPDVYRTYKRRWFYLFVLCLAEISNALIWINFSPIANLGSEYYNVSYNAINWLSLIYMFVTIPFTLPSTWLIDKLGIRAGLLFGTWLNAIGSLIRCLSVLDMLGSNGRFAVLMIGQFFCALAQTFILFIPTKFCFVWFSEQQRSLANSVAVGCSFLGALIGSVLSPLLAPTVSRIPLLLYVSAVPALCAALLCLGMRTAAPPTPSCRAVMHVQQPYRLALRKLFRSKSFVVLFIGSGIALGCFNALSTLVEQIMCPFGYDNVTIGYALGWFIATGSFGSVLFGYCADRTGRLEEISKILYATSAVAYILLALLIINQVERHLIYLTFAIVGFLSIPISPISMDLSLECVYPIPEATATGISIVSSQIIGIVMVSVFPKFARPLNAHEMLVETCSKDAQTSLTMLNYSVPLYIMAFMMVAVTLFYIKCFHCKYRRRCEH